MEGMGEAEEDRPLELGASNENKRQAKLQLTKLFCIYYKNGYSNWIPGGIDLAPAIDNWPPKIDISSMIATSTELLGLHLVGNSSAISCT